MSRRPPAGADRTEANRAKLKQLVKLESNKTCADCKRNKHPRWASWNIGVFVCIRCSGIHRGMGTHVSRVKSVDLDSWTDEQTESMIVWGNARANKYWEHKLAEGHVPNEAKIENFIRTKYDSKRWAMDGPIPDPNSLDDGSADDDVPLNVVQERVKGRERGASIRNMAAVPTPVRAPQMDLFGDEPTTQPARPSTTEPAISRHGPPKAPAAAPKQTKPGESLLGLDFLGGTQSATPARPSSTGPNTTGVSGRSDLKQSILSLYASKPTAPPPQPAVNAFGGMQGMQSPPLASPTQIHSNAQALGGLGDAFGSLSFSSQPAQQKPAPFSNFAVPTGHSRQASQVKSPPPMSGGSFFDVKPAPAPNPPLTASQPAVTTRQASNSFGADFGEFSSASPVLSTKSPLPASSNMGDLFDLSSPVPPPKPTSTSPPAPKAAPTINYSAFNLSQPTPASAPKPAQTSTMPSLSMNSMDAWGSNEAWATPDPPAATPPQPAPAQASTSTFRSNPTPAMATVQTGFDSGWGEAEPAKVGNTTMSTGGFSVQQDEEFGGWSHASPVATSSGPKQGGAGGNADDLFGNVWE